jgi:hypothetical protein
MNLTNRRKSPVPIFCTVAAVILGLVACGNFPVTDESMLKQFENNRQDFERLIEMISSDKVLYRVDKDWTDPSDPKQVGISDQRIAEYRALLRKVGCSRGFIAYPTRPGIYFVVSARGLATGGASQGICHLDIAPESLVSNTTSYKPNSADSYQVFRHIDGRWYIYFEYDD